MSYLDKAGAVYIISKIRALLAGKVDAVDGKTLSSNDYTSDEKEKLKDIAENANHYEHPSGSGNKHIPSGGVSGQFLKWSADGTAAWGADNDTTYSDMKGATASAAGSSGLVPAPAAGTQAQFLRADGTWQTPPNTTYPDATTSAHGLMSAADKTKLNAFGEASTYALKSDITNMYRYKGSVATDSNLPTSGVLTGDVYSITAASKFGAAGMNVAWTGSSWDNLGGIFNVESITNAEIDSMFA